MENPSYGNSKNLGTIDFDTALTNVTEALKEQGFGVLTEIDVKATLKNKLDVPFRNYRILGACNPPLAHQALSAELSIGLLLPCNIVVYENDDGTVTASALNVQKLFQVVDNKPLAGLADQVDVKLKAALDSL